MKRKLCGMELSEYLFPIKLKSGNFFCFDICSGKSFISTVPLYDINKKERLDDLKNLVFSIEEANKQRLSININVTNECNLNCRYCYFKASNKDDKIIYIDSEGVLKWISTKVLNNAEITELYINFLGGEPLLGVKLIVDIVDGIRKRFPYINVRFSVTSNGVFLTDEMTNVLALRGCESIQVTLDGSEKKHDSIRKDINGRGTYRLILQNIRKASERINIVIRVNFDENTDIDSIGEMLSDIKKIGLQKVYFAPIERNIDCKKTQGCTEVENSNNLKDKYIELWLLQKKMGFEIIEPLPMIMGVCIAKNKNGYAINYDGKLYPCPSMCGVNNLMIGDIVAEEKKVDKELHFRKECKNCILVPLCLGGCLYQEEFLEKADCSKNYKLMLLKSFFIIKYDLEAME